MELVKTHTYRAKKPCVENFHSAGFFVIVVHTSLISSVASSGCAELPAWSWCTIQNHVKFPAYSKHSMNITCSVEKRSLPGTGFSQVYQVIQSCLFAEEVASNWDLLRMEDFFPLAFLRRQKCLSKPPTLCLEKGNVDGSSYILSQGRNTQCR